MAFYNRQRELQTLSDAYTSGRAELVIVYGRRGVGKSTLLAHFFADKPHIYYRATRRTLPLQLETLTAMAREAYPDQFIGQPFASIPVFLGFLAHQARSRPDEPVVAILDEVPYLADVDRGLLTTIQNWWDEHKHLPNLKLFLCGSYVSFMEREVLGANAPLYNRRTGALKLEPFDYAEAALFFPAYFPRERIEAYAVLGGMPSYLEQFDPTRGLYDNLRSTALRRNTFLNQEPEWLLLEDLRTDVLYGSILRAIAHGQRRPSDIARAIGKQSAQDISWHLQSLIELNLIRREVPLTEADRVVSRNSLYFLADNYLAFWYRYVDPNRSLIAQGLESRVLDQIERTLHEFVARPPFEEVCRQFLWRAYAAGRIPADLRFNALGTWWDANHEIDVIAREGNVTTLAGSCKWTNAPMDLDDYAALRRAVTERAGDLTPSDQLWCALFSRTGFSTALVETAQNAENRLLLFRPDSLFE